MHNNWKTYYFSYSLYHNFIHNLYPQLFYAMLSSAGIIAFQYSHSHTGKWHISFFEKKEKKTSDDVNALKRKKKSKHFIYSKRKENKAKGLFSFNDVVCTRKYWYSTKN